MKKYLQLQKPGKSMQKILLLVVAAMFFGQVLADRISPRLMRNIKGFPVMKASLKKGVLTLTTTHTTVSLETYENIVTEGVCAVLENPADTARIKTQISRVEVLSRNEQQGYVFVDAHNACQQLSDITDQRAREMFFTGKTKRYLFEADELQAEKK